MSSALERLLARPSALRQFKCIIHNQHPRECRRALARSIPTYGRRYGGSTTVSPLVETNLLYSGGIRSGKDQETVTNHRKQGDHHVALLISLYTGAPLFEKLRDGRDAFEVLVYEADVASFSGQQDRLVDGPDASNMLYWLEILRFRRRINGNQGVLDVWTGMQKRHVNIPVEGPVADALWSAFITAGFVHADLLDQVYQYARNLQKMKGQTRAQLYEQIVGSLLRGVANHSPIHALHWHNRMNSDNMIPTDAMWLVAKHAPQSNNIDKALEAFKKIYVKIGRTGIYDACMPAICQKYSFSTALAWHKFLVKHDDLPSPALKLKPDVQHLFNCSEVGVKRSKPSRHFIALKESSQPHDDPPLLSRQNMSTMVGDVHGIKQKRLGDAFCARLFATAAFSVDLVIAGLKMIGMEEIGPLALREIGLRAQSCAEYLSNLTALEDASIQMSRTTFTVAARKFAEDDNDECFDILVRGDRHPDTYDDVELQQELFTSFLASGKRAEARATLAILEMHHAQPVHYSWNLLLQSYAARADYPHAMQILQDMEIRKIPITEKSLARIFHRFLRPRTRSKRPSTQFRGQYLHHDLDFVANVFLKALQSGCDFAPSRWREILRRYGKTNRFIALERLCLWLAVLYGPHGNGLASSDPMAQPGFEGAMMPRLRDHLNPEDAVHPLRQVFQDGFLRAIVAWGFISDIPPVRHERELRNPFATVSQDLLVAGSSPERWARGLALVRRLQDLGVHVREGPIRKEILVRLWILYGPGKAVLPRNRRAANSNRVSLYHYVRHIDQVWGSDVFHLGPKRNEMLTGQMGESELYVSIFGRERKLRRKGQKIMIDVEQIPQY